MELVKWVWEWACWEALSHIRQVAAFSSASSFTVRLEADTQAGAGGFRKPLERAR